MRSSIAVCVVWLLVGCSTIVDPNTDRLGTDPMGTDAGDTCAAPLMVCAGACADLQTDTAHCGGCGFACRPGVSCIGGVCECPPGDPACVGVGDPDACGPMRLSCSPDRLCVDGACGCRPGLMEVAGTCTDLRSDPNNCGAPGSTCDGVCLDGMCAMSCSPRTRACGGACVPQSDPRHCGGCDRACASDEVCVAGDCRDYDPASCSTCPCPDCDGDRCCPVGASAICVHDDACPNFG